MIAAINLASGNSVMLALHSAFLALDDLAGEPLFHDVVKAGVIIRELGFKIADGVFLCFVSAVVPALYVAHKDSFSFYSTCCQGIITAAITNCGDSLRERDRSRKPCIMWRIFALSFELADNR